ncbi:stage III sporulation protein SpoIIIAB [Shouchella lonarensis]|uniref:Stage III sporulation protein AB n=1 Tax=Shouchella lonarensis TaxID=1464122 RepID=A0A1G6ID36_9BACI|nr:stage III sporulation protein SpoIIIAB [Shouchella lonarensis]SDC04378.1 stage III sporulation protein AB [Shouchella lonarensis]
MKWLGACFIVLCTTLYGFHKAKALRERPQQLRQLQVALRSLEAEIMFGQTPLAEASERIAAQLSEPLSQFFLQFSCKLQEKHVTVATAWMESLDETLRETALKQSEREVLRQFGTTLGTTDRTQQQKQLKLAQVHLERDELEAKDLQVRYEKMTKMLGILAGLLLVILFL